MILKFELKTTNEQKIFKPLLQINYMEVLIPNNNEDVLVKTTFMV